MGKPMRVWALSDGDKIRREDIDHPLSAGNAVWDGRSIRLFAARNEIVAFQVQVTAGDEPLHNLRVGVTSLVHASGARIANQGRQIGAAGEQYLGDTAIEAATPNPHDLDPNHYVGRRIELFSQHYIFVPTELSTNPHWFFGPGAPPAQRHGWIPDALIPIYAKAGRGGMPLSTPANCNQGFWVDVFVASQDDLPAGTYHGNVQISCDGQETKVVPVELEVLDFTLPNRPHTHAMVYVSDIDEYLPGFSGNKLDVFRKMAHRHCIDVIGAPAHLARFSTDLLAEHAPYLSGEFFSPVHGYEGPGQGVGERLFPIGMYGRRVLGSEPEEMRAEAGKWVTWFEDQKWPGQYFLYLIDEPRADKFPWIREQAAILKEENGPSARLPIFTTRGWTPDLAGAIDIWATGMGINLQNKADGEQRGERFWFYNGYRPACGAVILEGEAVDLRVNSWIKWRYNIDTWFLWHGTHWRHNSQGPRGRSHQNVYAYPVTFVNVTRDYDPFYGQKGVSWGNGDGIFFYPGRDPFFPEQDRLINGPISSIRMKNHRRGAQDCEYLWLAEQAAGRTAVEAIAQRMVPKAMSEARRDEQVAWPITGDPWEQARRQLADLILAE